MLLALRSDGTHPLSNRGWRYRLGGRRVSQTAVAVGLPLYVNQRDDPGLDVEDALGRDAKALALIHGFESNATSIDAAHNAHAPIVERTHAHSLTSGFHLVGVPVRACTEALVHSVPSRGARLSRIVTTLTEADGEPQSCTVKT